MSEYPKAKYHLTKPHVQVSNAKEEEELGAEWFDHPDHPAQAVAKAQAEAEQPKAEVKDDSDDHEPEKKYRSARH